MAQLGKVNFSFEALFVFHSFLSPSPTMRLSLLFLAKLICQIGLLVFLLSYFGIPYLARYQNQEVMVVSSTRHSGGIAAPTLSLLETPFQRKAGNLTTSHHQLRSLKTDVAMLVTSRDASLKGLDLI